jgi:hypothetical protein
MAAPPVGCERAMTVIPSFLITGVHAILVSLLIITWASLLVQHKNGGEELILTLSLTNIASNGNTVKDAVSKFPC